MQCPIDHVDLLITDRAGIEIDYCPKCRGVWLDRSELDKIIERSTGNEGRRDDRNYDRRDDRRNQNDDDEEGGFLGNLFGGLGGGDND